MSFLVFFLKQRVFLMTATASFNVGSTLDIMAVLGPKSGYAELWHWNCKVLATTEKAVKLGAEGTKGFVWLPKSAITKTDRDGCVSLWTAKKIRCSYIAKQALITTFPLY
jgi:hypothetical protein